MCHSPKEVVHALNRWPQANMERSLSDVETFCHKVEAGCS